MVNENLVSVVNMNIIKRHHNFKNTPITIWLLVLLLIIIIINSVITNTIITIIVIISLPKPIRSGPS